MCLCGSVLLSLHCQIDMVADVIWEAIKEQIDAAALPHQSAEQIVMCNANEVIEDDPCPTVKYILGACSCTAARLHACLLSMITKLIILLFRLYHDITPPQNAEPRSTAIASAHRFAALPDLPAPDNGMLII